MTISAQLKSDIIAHAKQSEPQESCGFVILGYLDDQPFYLPCENQSADPCHYFEIGADDWVKADQLGEVIAVVHSHPDSDTEKGLPYLSTADRECQVQLNLPFWLVCGDDVRIFRPIPPLVGRSFINQQQDCRVLCLDAYMLAGLDIEQSELRYDFEWFEQGENLYEQYLLKGGFVKLSPEESACLGDVVLLQVGSPVPNHAGIYLGNQQMLHHSLNRLSARVPYDGFWLEQTHSIWRHKTWLQLNFTAILNDLMIRKG
ncbi:phage tail protein [Pasteurellaceae bacterium 15-036681]|nr:phage tail protein [Pasteurellaceae bacterium 15-036681]